MEEGKEEKTGPPRPFLVDIGKFANEAGEIPADGIPEAEEIDPHPPRAGGFAFADARRAFDRNLFDLEETVHQPHWAVPWSDLMMIAFIMFAVLFAYVVSKRDVGDAFKAVPKPSGRIMEAAAPSVPESSARSAALPGAPGGPGAVPAGQQNISLDQLYEMSKRTVGDAKDASVVMMPDHTMKLSVAESMLFDLGRADIKPGAAAFLRAFAKVLERTNFRVRIEGHTDSYPIHTPQFPTNWELSAVRAVNVTRFLTEECGLAPERFSVAGYSMYKPVVANAGHEEKAKNRRVEIVVVNETAAQ